MFRQFDMEDFDTNDNELEQREKCSLQSRQFRDKSDPFRRMENEFRGQFRLYRFAARDIFNDILEVNPSLMTVNANANPFS